MPPRNAKVVDLELERWQQGVVFLRGKKGELDGTSIHNVTLFLTLHPHLRGLYWYDEFADQIFIDRPLQAPGVGSYPRPIQDHDETELAGWLNANGLAPSIAMTAAVMRQVAFASPRNSIVEWAEGLKWDGDRRIDLWLSYYAGASDSEYTRMVGRRFLISAMARLLRPGCKVDTMLILEGPQGKGKSALVRTLAGDRWFSDQVGEVTNKDASQLIQGIWIMEIPEMDKFSRAEANAVKDFLTRGFDRYRPPYGRNVIRRERRCVFFGTINPDGVGYLKDTTGNRRYWPVEIRHIDLEGIAVDRDQLWAEAKHALEKGEKWWVDDDEAQLIAGEQDTRRDDDVWEPKVREWLEDPMRMLQTPFFTSSDVLWKAINLELKNQKQSEKIRVAKILKMLGCKQENNKNGIKGRSWEYIK